MKISDKYITVQLGANQTENNISFSIFTLFERELLLFPKNTFYADSSVNYIEGNLCLNSMVDNSYTQVGSWIKKGEDFELRISGKGYFSALKNNDGTYNIYKLEAVNALERLAVKVLEDKGANHFK